VIVFFGGVGIVVGMVELFLLIAVASGVVFGGLGWWIATQRNREPVEGLLLGAFFGPLGVLIEALLPNPRRSAGGRRGGGNFAGPSLAEQVAREETDDAAISYLDDR
jgi:hypothetical protein